MKIATQLSGSRVLQAMSLLAVMAATHLSVSAASSAKELAKPADIFQTTNIWTVHLKFTAAQWAAMEPKEGQRNSGRPGGFDPASFVAPAFLQQGDQNQDGKLSKEEFRALGERWFAAWDTNKAGRIDQDQLRDGLIATLLFGADGPGERGPGMRLQGREGQRNGLASTMGIEFEYVHADLEFDGRLLPDVAVRYKGNGTYMQSRGSLKRSLKIDLNKYSKGQKLAGLTKINLHSNVSDPSWMNEVMSHRLFRDAGVPAPRTAYARVFVTVPGLHDRKYFGFYSMVEDIDKHFAEEQFHTKQGAIFKPVTPSLFADLGTNWAKYKQTYDPKTTVSEAQTRRIMDFCQLVTKAGDAEFAARVGEFLDLEEFARFMAVTVWLPTLDSLLGPGQNFYVYLPPQTQKLQFLPWDLDHSFGQFPLIGTQEQRENLSIHRPWQGEKRFLERVFKVESFKKLYLARLAEFSQSIFKPERFHQQVDEIAAAIRPAVREESADKLARLDKVVAGEAVESMRGGGDDRRFGGGSRPGSKPIKPFVKARAQSVLDQLAGRLEGQTLGGFGMGGRGDRGGRGGFGPGAFLGTAVMGAFDSNRDRMLSHEEFTRGFARWFETWNTDKSGFLTEEQIRSGISTSLLPSRSSSFGRPNLDFPGRSRRPGLL